jgi:hypothetical protein
MATADELAEVRRNTDEPTEDRYPHPTLLGLIDSVGILRTSAVVWRWKAAEYAKMVDVSEAGSSQKLSDLYNNAIGMAKQFDSLADASETSSTSTRGRAQVYVIDRA